MQSCSDEAAPGKGPVFEKPKRHTVTDDITHYTGPFTSERKRDASDAEELLHATTRRF